MPKPYAEACDQNREPILAVIEPLLRTCSTVLEIGSGTGQHAVYFAARMPHLVWHTSDVIGNHAGIQCWLDEAGLANARAPIALDVRRDAWPAFEVDAAFSANTVHIMHWEDVQALFAGVGRVLAEAGLFLLYGPFNYAGAYTSDSNERFDAMLRARDPASGVRDFEDLDRLAAGAGMLLRKDFAMPANNRILCWEKRAP